MSKGVDRYQVLRTTRVRTAFKNDASWIHKPKDEETEQDQAGTTYTEKSSPVRQKSYVLSAARKFGSIDSSVTPPLHKTEDTPSEGFSTKHSNGEAIPAHKEPQPEGQTVEAAAQMKPQESTEQPLANVEALPETSGENGEAAGDKSNVENGDGDVETPTDVPVEDGIQPISSVKTNTESVPPLNTPEEPLAKTTSEKLEEPADTAVDPSNQGHPEVGVTAAVNVDNPSREISVVDGTVESNGTAEMNAAAETPAEPEGEKCEESPVKQATEEIVKSMASAEEISLVAEGASVPDIAESVSESPSQPARETFSVDSFSPAEAECTGEAVDAVVVESLPAVGETTEGEAVPDNALQRVPDTLSEPSAPPDAEAAAESINEERSGGAGPEVTVKAALEVAIESSPVISAVSQTTQEKESSTEDVVENQVQPTAEQSIDRTPESAGAAESDDKNVFEPTEASDAEVAQEKVVDQTIKLTDAMDVEIPETKTAPEPVEDAEVLSKETQMSQECNGTNISGDVKKPAEELNSTTTPNRYRYAKGICSFCHQKIDGNVKISLSDPHVESHPECLKCGVCAVVLGDLLKPLFLHGQTIKCGRCFEAAFRI